VSRASDAARLALARLHGADARQERVLLEPMPGGSRARSWLVIHEDGRRHVLRIAAPGSPALLDIEAEARAMAAAAAAGLAPAVVGVDARHGSLLTEFRPGRVWSAGDFRRPQNLVRFAALLRALHAVPAPGLPAFAATRIARRYLAALRGAGASPDARGAQWADELLERARGYDREHAPTAFCHNDLVATNVLDDGALALVDFEYAVRGTPLLDVANAVAMNGLSDAEQRALLEAYHGAPPPARELLELGSLVRMVRLMTWFWASLGVARTDKSSVYADYVRAVGAELQRD
jgi:Ser/Thr protein kinase RdoA (MazF antagonist)